MTDYVLAIDQGTTSTRFAVIDKQGHVVWRSEPDD